MTKDEFLKVLEGKLDILTDEERKKIVSEYKTKINKRIKKEKEEDVISSFGDIDILSKNILREKGIKIESSSNKRKKDSYFGEFINLIDNIASYISKKGSKELLKMLLDLVIIIVIVAVVKLPFTLIADIITGAFDILGNSLGGTINKVIYFGFELCYIIVAIFLFISLFKRRFEKYRLTE